MTSHRLTNKRPNFHSVLVRWFACFKREQSLFKGRLRKKNYQGVKRCALSLHISYLLDEFYDWRFKWKLLYLGIYRFGSSKRHQRNGTALFWLCYFPTSNWFRQFYYIFVCFCILFYSFHIIFISRRVDLGRVVFMFHLRPLEGRVQRSSQSSRLAHMIMTGENILE